GSDGGDDNAVLPEQRDGNQIDREIVTAGAAKVRDALVADHDDDHDRHQADNRQRVNAGLVDMARNRRQPQRMDVQERLTDRTGGPADEGDDFERVAPRVVRALAKLDDELTSPRNGGLRWKRLSL